MKFENNIIFKKIRKHYVNIIYISVNHIGKKTESSFCIRHYDFKNHKIFT